MTIGKVLGPPSGRAPLPAAGDEGQSEQAKAEEGGGAEAQASLPGSRFLSF